MKQPFQNTLLGFVISLILSPLVVNADTLQTTTSHVHYNYYNYLLDDRLTTYYRFLPDPAPEGLHYHVRIIATANIDDTPEEETVVLIVVETKPRTFSSPADLGTRSHAFLLIANTKGTKIEKKAFFKLFDTGTPPLDVPAAKVIERHSPPLGFEQPTDVFFRLVDVSEDGTLDIWVESEHGVALISFQDGEFKEVFSKDTVSREKLTDAFDVEYIGYDWPCVFDGQKYHRFLGNPQPENFSFAYSTRLKAIANIDDTPEKETIVLMVAQTSEDEADWGEWSQALLLIAEADTETDALSKKKDLFKLFAARTYPWDVPAKTIEFQRSPPVFRGPLRGGGHWGFQYASFDLVDLTGDGILDIWVEQAEGVAVISFQDGEFKEVCSGYSSPRREDPIEYIDLDNDGIYEIKIPDRIGIDGVPGAAYPEWVSLYEWDGNTYILNNERFYAENDKFFIDLLNLYNHVLIQYGRFDEYSFCIGLVFYYRGNAPMARKYLQWIANHAEKQHYVHTAEELLKKLPSR